ncbi:hypothetical protein V2A60_005713 [Cordyceps javanica]
MATISQIKQHCDASSSPEACMESANICAKRLLTNRRERLIPIHRIQACADRIQKPPSAGEASTSASVSAAFKADIRVDTNRDGVVDVTGSSDEEGKNEWTNASGAIFLANIGDSNGRCKQTSAFQSPDTPLSQLIKCHDADDDEQRAPQFMAPMRTMPLPDLSNNATGSLVIGVEPARSQVRIFQSKGDKWQIVKDDTVISAEDLKQGLTLGVDSRSTRLPNGWDGHVSVDFIVKDGGSTSFDSVALRVAPVMIHHHKQAVNKLFSSTVRRAGEVGEAANKALDSLETSMPLERLPTPDVWAQDFFEPGYMSMPGPDGKPISLRIVLEGRRGKRDSQRLIYTQLRDTGVGAADPILRTRGYKETPIQATLQAGGNTESIPPYEFDGKKFPAGRIILGGEDADLPRQLEFYRAQEVQDPLVLDSMWLRVKHVDEMMQFLPSQTPQGFAMVAVDPELGLQKLREASKAGHGSQPIFSKTKVSSGPSIDEFLASKANIDATAEVGRRMNANIELIKKETGLADDAIFRMPMLVGLQEDVDAIVRLGKQRRRSIPRRQNQTEAEALDQELLVVLGIHGDEENDVLAADDGKVDFQLERRAGATPHMSYLPSMVNGVPLSDSHYMAPKPFGPEINGEDIFETAAKNLYQKVGFSRVDFHDTWVFHKAVGDIHCMTNTYRDTSDKWW